MTSRVKRVAKNLSGNDFIVGDIHGCFTKLKVALNGIGFDSSVDRLFSVGDLVDRGPESLDAIRWLEKPWFFAVLGNHEQMAIDWADGCADQFFYIQNGGSWNAFQTAQECRIYGDAFNDLPVAIELETENGLIGIVHADCLISPWSDFVEALAGKHSESVIAGAIWSRHRISLGMNGEDTGTIDGVKAVVVGHTVLENPVILGNVHHIDTGAFLDMGRFTIISAKTLEVVSQEEVTQ